jgi:type I restriction enzyme S subunit
LGLDPNGLSRLWIPVPGKSLLVAYKSFLMPLEQKKSNLIKETSKLKSLRDWMLPMLMNGQLIVE